jgi:hypothetical protein
VYRTIPPPNQPSQSDATDHRRRSESRSYSRRRSNYTWLDRLRIRSTLDRNSLILFGFSRRAKLDDGWAIHQIAKPDSAADAAGELAPAMPCKWWLAK